MILIKAALGILKGKIFGKKVPLKVQHYVTYRCNYHCSYCNLYNIQTNELNTEQIKSIISNFSKAGAVSWTFTGGEPLLREDIKELVLHAKNLGLHTAITTNGSLVQKHIDWLHKLDQITISIDGPEEINDRARGKGSFKTAIEAIKLLKEKGLNPFQMGVINKENIKNDYEGIKGLLNLANDLKIKVVFLPVYKDNFNKNKSEAEILTQEELLGAIKILKDYKKKYKNKLVMSYVALDWFSSKKKFKTCLAGHLLCTISPDGSVSHCLFREKEALKENSPLNSFYKLPKIKNCSCNLNCYIEYNHLLSLNLKSIKEFIFQYF